jgi:putative transposase
MPWESRTSMDLRVQFIADYYRALWPMSELCARYGVSRKTGYKWIGYFEAQGPAGLADHSRRPRKSPFATPADIRQAVEEFRRRHPTWGAKKLLARLRKKEPKRPWPAASTACRLLRHVGLVRQCPHRSRVPRPRPDLVVPVRPNQLWTTDFKGQFRTQDRRYCYPLTVLDGFSRFALECYGMTQPVSAETQRCFTGIFEQFGLPEVIRSDNGTPFASTALAGLSRLSVWWMQLGVRVERITPAHPEENGSHERFHRTLKAETARPPAANCARQQERFVRFRGEYNDERPHEALGLVPPGEIYTPSARRMPRRLEPPRYPGHWEVRRVNSNACVKWGGEWLCLTSVLVGHDVGFEEVDDGLWTVYFGCTPIGRFDERDWRVYETHERPLRSAASAGPLGS